MWLPRDFLALCALLTGGFICGACSYTADAPFVAVIAEPVIYGVDDRVEPEALSEVAWIAGAATRAVALLPSIAAFSPGADAEDAGIDAAQPTQTAMARFQLCPEERFGDQPSLADCSGVLVSNDLVLTAGHCFTATDACDRYVYAVDYRQESVDTDAGGPDLLRCQELVIREVGQLADGSPIDYALVRLERSVDSAASILTVRDESLQAAESVMSMGFPEGLPLKIDPNGEVVTVDRTGFRLLTDAYHGSSGSGVYDGDGRLVGILTSGEPDFEWDAVRGCQFSRVIAAGDSDASERAMNAWVALSRACFRVPELALCASLADSGALEKEAAIVEEAGAVDSTSEGMGEAPSKSAPSADPQGVTDAGEQSSVSPMHDRDSMSSAVGHGPDAGLTAPDRELLRQPAGCSISPSKHVAGSLVSVVWFVIATWSFFRRRIRRARGSLYQCAR